MPLPIGRLLIVLILPAVLLWGGFSAYALWGDNYQRVMPNVELVPDEVNWQMLVGNGALDQEGYAIVGAHESAYALLLAVQLPWGIDADDVERVELTFGPGAQYLRMNLGWSENSHFPRTRMGPIEMESATLGIVETDWIPAWRGRIGYLAVEIVGGLARPVVLERIELKPARPDFAEFQRRLFSEWVALPPWTQRSANRTRVSLQPEIVSPLVAVASWLGLVVLLLVIVPWFRAGHSLAVALIVPVMIAWLALDLRWQANLSAKALDTVENLAGKDWHERLAVDFDGNLFNFVTELKEDIGSEPDRVFALGYGEFWRLRTRYHGVPWSVRTTDRPLHHGWTRHLRSGDLLILLDTPHIERVQVNDRRSRGDPFDGGHFELAEIAGSGGGLIERNGQPVLALQPAEQQLLRARIDDLQSTGFYTATVRLAAGINPETVRIRIRYRDEETGWRWLADREMTVGSSDFEDYDLVFPVEGRGVYEVIVRGTEDAELYTESLHIDRIENENLLYLQSSPTGPALVVQEVLDRKIGSAYKIQ
jgi:hypothetical protein